MYIHAHTCIHIYIYIYVHSYTIKGNIATSDLPADQEYPFPWQSPWQFFHPTNVYKGSTNDCIRKREKDVIYIHIIRNNTYTCKHLHTPTPTHAHTFVTHKIG